MREVTVKITDIEIFGLARVLKIGMNVVKDMGAEELVAIMPYLPFVDSALIKLNEALD